MTALPPRPRPAEGPTPDHPLDAGTDLAFERSRLATERTLMAWIRTSLSMISFGFSIYKFFQYLGESPAGVGLYHHGPRNLGRVMVVLGVLLLVPATIQLIGIGAVLSVFFRLGPF